MKKQLKRQKYTFNISLLKYKKYITKLNRLRMLGKNEHRQNVLTKHIVRLEDRLSFLFVKINKATAIATFAGALLLTTTTANAQTFAGARGCYANIDGLVGNIEAVEMVDIDGDGDLDVFATNSSNTYAYYQNTGTATAPVYAAPINNAFNFNIPNGQGTILRLSFGDLDNDGDLDIMARGYGSMNRYFENIGTATAPDFAADIQNPFGLVSTSNKSMPELVDIDGDGDLDYFVVDDNGGAFEYFENISTATTILFATKVDNPFGLYSTGSQATMAFGDMDGDGDYDILRPYYDRVIYIENTGTTTAPAFALPTQLSFNNFNLGGLRMNMQIVDYDGNGVWDIVAGDKRGFTALGDFILYKNVGTNAVPDFSFPDSKVISPFGLNAASGNVFYQNFYNPTLGDLDNDGDLDIIHGDYSNTFKYIENTGTPSAPAYSSAVGLNGVSSIGNADDPFLVDIDGDGDLDLFRVDYYGTTFYYNENTTTGGTLSFGAEQTDPFSIPDCPSGAINTTLTFADVNNDGLIDMLVGNSTGDFYYFENTGTASVPVFSTVVTNPFNLTAHAATWNYSYMKPAFIDMDTDGDLDIMTGNSDGDYIYYENIGSASAPNFTTEIVNPFGITAEKAKRRAYPCFGDFDNDGDMDMLSGTENAAYYENITTAQAILVSSIATQGQGGATTITIQGGTLQMEAAVLPANATDGSYIWSVASGTGSASIDAAGMLTALTDGTVTVTATANDASGQIGTAVITISNQAILVSSIATQGQGGASTITTQGGTLQMEAAVLPANATDGTYIWSVASGTGSASIDASGMLTALTDGTVTVTAAANDASGQIGTAVITISNQSIGIQEDLVQQVKIFPNPTTGEVTFDTDKKIENIEIFNLTGELVSNYFNTNTIDMSQLPNGIYLAKIIIGGSSPIVQKLIKD